MENEVWIIESWQESLRIELIFLFPPHFWSIFKRSERALKCTWLFIKAFYPNRLSMTHAHSTFLLNNMVNIFQLFQTSKPFIVSFLKKGVIQ